MPKVDIEGKARAIDDLRRSPDREAVVAELKKALKQRNNYLAAKAAKVASDLGMDELLPELRAAYDRFLSGGAKGDPQCWAKIALVRALKELGHRDPEPYLRGLECEQLGAWVPPPGERDDAAGPLRSACISALLECSIDDVELLTRLADRLTDRVAAVRADAAAAVGRAGAGAGVPLLRLKASTGDREPEVLGQCFFALLELAQADAVPFIAKFIDQEDDPDARVEAAAALAEAPIPQALEAARRAFEGRMDRDVREAVLSGLGGSKLEAAAEYLFEVYEDEPAWRDKALEALERSRHWRAYENEIRR